MWQHEDQQVWFVCSLSACTCTFRIHRSSDGMPHRSKDVRKGCGQVTSDTEGTYAHFTPPLCKLGRTPVSQPFSNTIISVAYSTVHLSRDNFHLVGMCHTCSIHAQCPMLSYANFVQYNSCEFTLLGPWTQWTSRLEESTLPHPKGKDRHRRVAWTWGVHIQCRASDTVSVYSCKKYRWSDCRHFHSATSTIFVFSYVCVSKYTMFSFFLCHHFITLHYRRRLEDLTNHDPNSHVLQIFSLQPMNQC